MLVRELRVDGFRNLETGAMAPEQGVNILYGDNAQGKTNFLEACWLFTGSRSFRGSKDSELVAFGRDKAALELNFFAGGREQNARLEIERRRRATLNGAALPSAARLAGVFCGVVFSPTHLSLIKDGPDARRRFTDAAYCQLRPGYVRSLAEYSRVLTQRNALLKAIQKGDTLPDEQLDGWDHALAAAGARLTMARCSYIARLQPLAADIYDGLSGGRENFSLTWQSPAWQPGITAPELAQSWLAILQGSRTADKAAGFSTAGAHREDMIVSIDDLPVRTYGSQGQQRSAVLALKLAEAALLQQITGEPPVAFLDDVMSELDVSRQDYILNHIHDWQVFITCCEPSSTLRMTAGKIFHIQNGKLI